MNVLRKIESVCWGTPPSDPKERKLVRKLDSVILSYVCLSCEWGGFGQ
jgi:ACS family pantothenate transporter-like MFS transporter